MMKKRLFIAALAATCSAGIFASQSDVAQAEEEKLEGLPPLVMILFDTSGSMDYCFEDGNGENVDGQYFCQGYPGQTPVEHVYIGDTEYKFANESCNTAYTSKEAARCETIPLKKYSGVKNGCSHTRLTKAIAEIAGAPKRDAGTRNQLILASEQYPIRAKYECSDSSCNYGHAIYSDAKDTAYKQGEHLVEGYPAGSECVLTGYSYCVSYVPGRGNPSPSDEDAFQTVDKEKYNDDGVIQAYKSDVKFGFAGFDYTGKNIYGLGSPTINEVYKTMKMGISNANPLSQAPLLYPVAKDDSDSILKRNTNVAISVRGYWAGGGTPIGPALADLNHLFNEDIIEPTTGEDRDNIVWQRDGSNKKYYRDDKYACRDKAVILITDGAPERHFGVTAHGQAGQAVRVWEDVRKLSDNKVKTYVVGYSMLGLNPRYQPGNKCLHNVSECNNQVTTDAYDSIEGSLDEYAGDILNRLAWQGGTCYNPVTRKLIEPNDVDGYKAMLAQCADVPEGGTPSSTTDHLNCTCYYDASTATGLRSALVTVLSDLLKGTYTKTKVAMTSAYGQQKEGSDTGYYEVYSGYNVSAGAIRQTLLERQATECNSEAELVDGTYIDFAHRLKCRLTTCDTWRPATEEEAKMDSKLVAGVNYRFQDDNNRSGYGKSFDKQCAERSDDITDIKTNECLSKRYIFAADYKAEKDRNAISTLDKAIQMTSLNDDSGNIGIIPKNETEEDNYIVGASRPIPSTTTFQASVIYQNLKPYATMPNYRLSPFECVSDLDCGRDGLKERKCDLGRCVFMDAPRCADNSKYEGTKTQICINGIERPLSKTCSKHADCGTGKVCHAGACADGIVIADGQNDQSTDIRPFLATLPLGTIEYATPVILNPPKTPFKSNEYMAFKNTYKDRDTMLFAPANDGMVHAFVLGKNETNYKTLYTENGIDTEIKIGENPGDEVWAYIPKNIMPKLRGLTAFGQQSLINATPVVADVHVPSTAKESQKFEGSAWRSVLVGGFGTGARGYYALDVTDPANPIVLWEIDNTWTAKANPGELKTTPTVNDVINVMNGSSKEDYPFMLMGFSSTEPVITNMLIDNGSTDTTIEPVVILTSGMSDNGSTAIEDMTGHALYIVRLYPKSKEDLVVKTFYFEDRLTGTPAVYPNNFNSTAQHIYVGDQKGKLYRLNVKGQVENWGSYGGPIASQIKDDYKVENPAFDLKKDLDRSDDEQDFAAITFAPAVSQFSLFNGRPAIQLGFGTGENTDFLIDNDKLHYIASMVDVPTGSSYLMNAEVLQGFNPFVLGLSANGIDKKEIKKDGYQYRFIKHDPIADKSDDTKSDEYALKETKLQKLTAAPITYNFETYFATTEQLATRPDSCPGGQYYVWKLSGADSNKRWKSLSNDQVQNKLKDDEDPYTFDGKKHSYFRAEDRVYGMEISNPIVCTGTKDGKSFTQNYAPELKIAKTGADIFAGKTTNSIKRSQSATLNTSSLPLDIPEAKARRLSWASVYE